MTPPPYSAVRQPTGGQNRPFFGQILQLRRSAECHRIPRAPNQHQKRAQADRINHRMQNLDHTRGHRGDLGAVLFLGG